MLKQNKESVPVEKSLDTHSNIPIKYFLLCSLVDIHGTLLIVKAYNYTSITSVMLLEDFTIPSVLLLSLFFLKIKYKKIHFTAIAFCFCGMSISIFNDFYIKQ